MACRDSRSRGAALRWRRRRSSWKPLREPFDPTHFYVEPLSKVACARSFIETHHYSKAFPVSLACYGLFERVSAFQTELSGVAVFSIPIQPRAAAAYGAGAVNFCDLGRFLLLHHVGLNAETWALARALLPKNDLVASTGAQGVFIDATSVDIRGGHKIWLFLIGK